ncbi:MAG TPA: aromatic amino acid lyase [Xanthomonadales bacterium]|nr:aromatic amino acid lyase [Xanthomonadales bacterium]
MPVISETSPPTLDRLASLLGVANQNAALAIEALCSESAVLSDGVQQSCPDAGQVEVAAQIRALVGQSQLAVLAVDQVPRFVIDRTAPHALGVELDLDPRAAWQRGAHQLAPDRYSVHCTPQIHGALLDQLRRSRQIAEHAVIDAACTAGACSGPQWRESVATGGHRRSTKASGVANFKAAIAALSSISERRLAKLLDPKQNNGLPASLVPNPDGNHYGLMVLRYRAALLVSQLSDLATPVCSTPLSAWAAADQEAAQDADESAPADGMCDALANVLALERFAAVQALRVRIAMLQRVYGPAAIPMPGDFAKSVIDQFDAAGLEAIWDGRKLQDEIDTAAQLMLKSPAQA